MRRRFPPRPSASFVIAVLALFLALGGTTLARALITGADIRDGSITGADIKNHSVGGIKIKNDSITGTEIKESSLSKVPSAQNAETLGGKAAGEFAPAGQWALIAGSPAGAHVLAQSGGLAVERLVAGAYLVDAGRSVASKPLSATFNYVSGGFISVGPCGGTAGNPGGINCPVFNDTNHVLVRTVSPGGMATDSTFYLSIGG